jgi:Lrp/AsnC family transcriptional regulator, leucine-responsive regulatory protein
MAGFRCKRQKPQLRLAGAAPDAEIRALRRQSCTMPNPLHAVDCLSPGEPDHDIRHIDKIDKIDRRILRVLQADGRISNLKLAEEVHLSPTAVLERVRRLHRDGFILGYEARLNPAKLGAGLLVFVEILLDRTVHDVMDTFKAAVQVRPEILEAHLVAGGFDYLLKTRVADMTAYRQFIGSVIWTLPGVRETRTYAVMEEVKSTSLLPV